MFKQLFRGIRVALALTVLTGFLYPGVVTGLCQLLFHQAANGSLIEKEGRPIGSTLIGQSFRRAEYFHPRPSSAGAEGYDASASGGSNLGPTSRRLIDRVKADIDGFRKENPDYLGPIPADMVTASGSGLDPHISPASALAQAPRIARARGTSTEQMESLIKLFAEDPDFGFLGEPRINVLLINLALDRQFPIRNMGHSDSGVTKTILVNHEPEGTPQNSR
jgi:K+-transporting ATPase ATPase C chain